MLRMEVPMTRTGCALSVMQKPLHWLKVYASNCTPSRGGQINALHPVSIVGRAWTWLQGFVHVRSLGNGPGCSVSGQAHASVFSSSCNRLGRFAKLATSS